MGSYVVIVKCQSVMKQGKCTTSWYEPSYKQVAAVNMYINNNMDEMSRFPAGFVKAFQEYYT